MDSKPLVKGGIVLVSLAPLFKAVIVIGKMAGWWKIEETDAQALVGALDAVYTTLVSIGTLIWVSRKTTPLVGAKDVDGVKLVREDTHGPTIYEEKKSDERSIKR